MKRLLDTSRMSDEQLWRTLSASLSVARMSCESVQAPRTIAPHVRKAEECAAELRLRGTQLTLGC